MKIYALILIAFYIFDTGFMFAKSENELNEHITKGTRVVVRILSLLMIAPILYSVASSN